MSENRPASIWAGRTLALIAIVLLALNLRTAVASLSPVFDEIGADVPLTSVGIGVLGTLPPICFAVFGLLAPAIARRVGLDTAILLSAAAMVVGHLLRGLSNGYPMLVATSVLVLGGVGIGNVLIPPAVKRYFPDKLGTLTALSAALLATSAAIPPLVSAPLATSVGWRWDLSVWGIVALTSVAPWLWLWLRERRARMAAALGDDPEVAPVPPLGRTWHSRVAWSTAIVFAASSFSAYAMFAWLPAILRDTAGTDAFTAGALLSLYAIAGVPTGILVPLIAVRIRNPGLLVFAGVALFLIGYGGLLLAPAAAPWLWVTAAGFGPLLFPLAMVLINLRTRTQNGSAALSGFTQGIGYIVGATGPLLLGLLHQLSGGWTLPLLLVTAVSLAAVPAGLALARPRMLEDDLAARAARLAKPEVAR
ncbi:MFS transporter [Naasia aerilata]|uniref:MFS transporter n=1 Tax=Naasia aerilata TaxID=1162966 RepID=A0ABM8GH58_9MICO|nr:MFS transporter [Naasia aerilata]BDZ47686.1 MFS transporter [Naasia aerilata]